MSRFYLGLDLGQAADSTGLAVVERLTKDETVPFSVRHLQRFPPGTAYAAIGIACKDVIREANLGRPTVVTGITAVGPGVLKLLRAKLSPSHVAPVMITTGTTAIEIDGFWQAPKRDLVTSLQLNLQERRLTIAAGTADAGVLVRELSAFRARVIAPLDGTPDWRDRPGDDLVLAIALACWWAERHPPWTADSFSFGRSMIAEELDHIFPHLAEPRPW